MFNTAKRAFALVLALVLVFSLAGCSKPVSDGSSVEWIVEEQIEYIDGDGTSSGDGTTSVGDTTTTSSGSTPTTSGDKKPTTLINDNVDYTKYKGRTVKFAATIDPKNDESGPVVKKFEEKYGIKIEIIQSDQSNYANQLAGWIAAGTSPDVARVNGDFPTCMGYLQSLDAAKLDYNEVDFWNKNMFDYSTFGGSPYLCDAKNNIWTEIDIVIYSKSMLKRAGVQYTPEEFDKAGKWTWDTYFEICRMLKKLDPSTMQGGSFASRESAIHAMGGSLIHYENGKFVSGVNKRTEEAMVKYTTAWKEEIIGWTSIIDGIVKGTSGIGTTHAWALKKTGFFQNTTYNTADLGFYYLPRWDANSDYGNTGMVRGWGIIRGANEPVAAGIFLREYLDVSNYDSASTFISPEAETFFYRVTSIDYDKWNPYIVYFAYQDGIAGTTFDEHNNAMSGDPNQVASAMASIKSCMERAAANINKFVEQNTGLK